MYHRRIGIGLIVTMTGMVLGCQDSSVQHDDIDKIYIEAHKVIATDPAKAIDLLDQVVEAKPDYHVYFNRAWCYARLNKDDQAKADVEAGLKLSPDFPDLKWLEAELNKPAAQRKLNMPPAKVH